MLDGDAAAERLYTFEIAIGNGLAVIEEPVQPLEWYVAVYFLKHVEEARDAFVVGRVQAERPFVRREQRNDSLQFAFEGRRQIGARFEKIFKVGRGEHEHFAPAVAAQEIVPFAWASHLDPAREVLLLLLWLLREEIVSNAECEFATLMQFLDDGVVLRVILIAAARINDAGEAEPVQFSHEVARGIQLMLRRQL